MEMSVDKKFPLAPAVKKRVGNEASRQTEPVLDGTLDFDIVPHLHVNFARDT
jgi:hypothetical protein